MSEAKHTPGIWFVNYESKDVGDGKLSIEVDGDYFIAQVDEGICQEANARLISAAPDLLEALQESLAALEWAVDQGGGPQCDHESGVVCFCKENNAINAARAAIAKATGK